MSRNRDTIRQTLLNTGEFLVNDYFEQYLDLVSQEDQPRTRKGCQKHHILQRFYFKMVDQPVNSKKENLINLLYRDHCLAHWLLYNCTKGALRRANASAFVSMVNKSKVETLSETEYQELQRQRELVEIEPLIDKDVLESFLANHSHLEASREFGISLNAITEYKRKYGLPVKGRDVEEFIDEEEFKAYVTTHNNIETAAQFNICTATVIKLKKLWNLSVKQSADISKIDPIEFANYLKNHSNVEASSYFNICPNSVTKLEKKLGLKLKCKDIQQQLCGIGTDNFIAYTSTHSIQQTSMHFDMSAQAVTVLRRQLGVTNKAFERQSSARLKN